MNDNSLAKEILRVRLSQLIINEKYKANVFKIPLHIALGHEAIAVALDSIMEEHDFLALSHRNMHYNLARTTSFKPILNEYLLKADGLAGAELGSMNLANPAKNILYTSSILGNNLIVATGIALGESVKGTGGLTIVVTGDGAIEEGSFYESLLFARSNDVPLLIIVENNNWSMHTAIHERRFSFDMAGFASALGADYALMEGNDVYDYSDRLSQIRKSVLANRAPFVLEVSLVTLGGWYVDHGDKRRFIHPHAGPLPETVLSDWPELEASENDPIFVLKSHFADEELGSYATKIYAELKREIEE